MRIDKVTNEGKTFIQLSLKQRMIGFGYWYLTTWIKKCPAWTWFISDYTYDGYTTVRDKRQGTLRTFVLLGFTISVFKPYNNNV